MGINTYSQLPLEDQANLTPETVEPETEATKEEEETNG